MKGMTCIAAILLALSATTLADVGSQEEFCLGEAPSGDKAPAAKQFYEEQCPAILDRLLAKQKQQDLKEAKEQAAAEQEAKLKQKAAEVELLQKVGDQLKPADPKLPDLAAFTATAQHYLADLAFAGGKDVANKLKAKLPKMAGQKALVVKDSEAAALWFDTVDVRQVSADLTAVKSNAAAVNALDCKTVGAPIAAAALDPITMLSSLTAVANGVAGLLQLFNPLSTVRQPPDHPPTCKRLFSLDCSPTRRHS